MYNTPPKMEKKKIIEITIVVVLILWGLIFIINLFRYSKSEPLIFAIKRTYDSYEDGYVNEYVSLGYIYRSYHRTSIKKEELVPFWVTMSKPDYEVINALPQPEALSDEDIPDNPNNSDKYMGLLYFYSTEKNDFLDAYKCINSTQNCNKATGGWDLYNLKDKDPLTRNESHKFENLYDKYAWIDDSSVQDLEYGDIGYIRTIYLYKFNIDENGERNTKGKGQILAKYADIKESNYDDSFELSDGDNYRYIVKSSDNNKWGVIKVKESGEIEEVIPFEYDSITFDSDTGYYILGKDDIWNIYDISKNTKVSEDFNDPIYDVWKNNNSSYYIKTGKDRTVGSESFTEYKVYTILGKEVLTSERITEIVEEESYIMYLNSVDKKLHFMTYGKVEKYTVQLNFTEMDVKGYNKPAFEIVEIKENQIVLKIYEKTDPGSDYDMITVFTTEWENND